LLDLDTMTLASGYALAHYPILSPLGAGAMVEVYRARGTKLGREVAIKVLPEHFADEPERLKRFEREATTLASLSHPNVAQIFGVDPIGDTCFLVLELGPGELLEVRLRLEPRAFRRPEPASCSVRRARRGTSRIVPSSFRDVAEPPAQVLSDSVRGFPPWPPHDAFRRSP